MADPRPRLVAVGEPAERPGRARDRADRQRLVVLLLAGVLVLCAVGWGLASREAGVLARQLAETQSALAQAEERLQALEAERAEVRTRVEALAADAAAFAGRLGELEALVAADHAPAAHAQPPGNSADPAD
jgi:septal ring factor EnvC (AmiA/AmiB activator)